MPESKETARDLPLVSVVMPAYNHERFVEEAVRSVWAQTYPHVELIVLNDGSPDRTGEILDRLQAESPIPMRVVHKENEGLCRTLNRGLAISYGELVAFLASDDIMHLDKLEVETACISQQAESVAGCYGDLQVIDEEGKPLGVVTMQPKSDRDDLFLSFLMSARPSYIQACLYRKRVVDHVGGFDESLRFEDLDFMLRLTQGHRLIYTGAISVAYRKAEGGLASKMPNYVDDFHRIVDKHLQHDRISELGRFGVRKVLAHNRMRVAYILMMEGGSKAKARKSLVAAIRQWPWAWRIWATLGLSLIPRSMSSRLAHGWGLLRSRSRSRKASTSQQAAVTSVIQG